MPDVSVQLGRLYIRTIPLPPPEVTAGTNTGLPSVRNVHIPNFLLVLNGAVDTPWHVFADLVSPAYHCLYSTRLLMILRPSHSSCRLPYESEHTHQEEAVVDHQFMHSCTIYTSFDASLSLRHSRLAGEITDALPTSADALLP